ncbi:g6856 [Coccomyxa elongata]
MRAASGPAGHLVGPRTALPSCQSLFQTRLSASGLVKLLQRPTWIAQTPRRLQRGVSVQARGSGRTRLATRITTVPRRVDLYFADQPLRRVLWSCIAFGCGYYSANTVSLSFGALAINDVVAAALTVAFCEVVSSLYYGAPRATLKLLFLQSFKIGIICALIADAFKLGG